METTLEELVKYVGERAEREAEEIRSRADAEFEKTKSTAVLESEKRLSEQEKLLEDDLDKRIAEFKRQESAKASRRATDYAAALSEKVFVLAEERLSGLDREKFAEYFRVSVSGLSLKGEYDVVLGENSKGKLDPSDVKACCADGLELRLADRYVKDSGGFVIVSGKVEYSFLFSDLLGELKKTEQPLLISKIAAQEV